MNQWPHLSGWSSINEEHGHEVPEESLCVYEYEATQSSQVPTTQQKVWQKKPLLNINDNKIDVLIMKWAKKFC